MSEFYGTEDDSVLPARSNYISTTESYILLCAVKYTLTRRTYGSFLIGNYITNNLQRIEKLTLREISDAINTELTEKNVPIIDVPEWNRILNKIYEFLQST